MASILPMDELNRLDAEFRARFGNEPLPNNPKILKEVEDTLFDFFLFAYAMGNEVTNENLSSSYKPTVDEVEKTVNQEVAGKTWRNRVEEYFSSGGTGADISRIADTEMHRIANTAAYKTAKQAGAKSKTWITMADEKVRDSHQYLEMMTVGIDDDFYTFDGDHSPYPGAFALASNNVNCRCELLFS